MRNWLMLGFGVLIVGLLNFGVVQKEQVIADGTAVYLELRPVDPRSLLQGDFMRLGFEVENNVRSAIVDKKIRSGFAIVKPDQNGVAQFVRLDDGTALADAEYSVHFTKTSSRPTLVPNSFLFQEGEGEDFASAEFAVLIYGADRRDYVLRGLANANKQLINPRDTLGWN